MEFQDDLLILAGDISHDVNQFRKCISELTRRFRAVLFVPGNHDLWIVGNEFSNSFDKFYFICNIVKESGATVSPVSYSGFTIVPLFSWYDYSFGQPSYELLNIWMDYKACVWPEDINFENINGYFLNKNPDKLAITHNLVMTFSHFLPRIDVIPEYIRARCQKIHPVLGSVALDDQIRLLKSSIHVYGHSHVNNQVEIDGVRYINNAFGSPKESFHTIKRLLCIYEN